MQPTIAHVQGYPDVAPPPVFEETPGGPEAPKVEVARIQEVANAHMAIEIPENPPVLVASSAAQEQPTPAPHNNNPVEVERAPAPVRERNRRSCCDGCGKCCEVFLVCCCSRCSQTLYGIILTVVAVVLIVLGAIKLAHDDRKAGGAMLGTGLFTFFCIAPCCIANSRAQQ